MKPELINSLKGYKPKNLINDVLSGLLVAIIAMPLSIALGLQSVPDSIGGGIQMGIITAIIAGFIVSAFGGSRFQIGGPTAAFVGIIFGYLSDPEIGLIGLQIATIIAGIILLLLGVLKLGSLVKYIPYPIIVGFTSGIGVTLLVGQIKDFCGFDSNGVDFIEKIIGFITAIKTFNLASFLIGVGVLLTIYILKKVNNKIPGAFIAIILFTIINILIGGESLGVKTIGSKYGDIKAEFEVIDFSLIFNVNFLKLILPAIVIAFLGALESLLSLTVADGMSKLKSDVNQELLGQGLANIGSAFCGGLPATGAIARTSANISSGAKSSLAGVFHAVFMLIMYFALMGVIKFIPLCALGAVLISVAIKIMDVKLFVKLSKFGIRDSIILFLTMLLTVFTDLTYGVLGGLALSFILNAKNLKTPFKVELIKDGDNKVHKVSGELFFLTANKMCNVITKQFESEDKIIIDFSNVNRIDSTTIEKLSKLSLNAKNQGKVLEIIGCNEVVKSRIQKYFNNI